ncbi:MAG: pyruvate kinase [Chlamydiota bacterium]
MKRTKIICTLGPAVDSLEKIEALIRAGMNIARFNFSHGAYEEHKKRIEWVKKARESLGVACALMLDTKGPEIRVGILLEDKIALQAGQKLSIVEKASRADEIPIDPISVIDSIEVGMTLLFNDGYISSRVIEKTANGLVIQMNDSGTLLSRKGINVPDAHLNLPALTDRDVEDLIFGCKMDIDMVAASFIRSSEHVLAIKRVLTLHQKPDTLVIAKIENREGIENFDTIVQVSDGIMVARGDLGVELDPSVVPRLQKMMVRKCFDACKPVTIATQMLESMIVHPRATRAEVSDVANAIYDGSSSIMLSAESSVGKYPIEAVTLMGKIACQSEEDFNNREFYKLHSGKEFHPSSVVASSAVNTAYTVGAKAIFVFTTSGLTVRALSRFKPEMPVIAVTDNQKIFHQMSFFWGVISLLAPSSSFANFFALASKYATQKELIHFGDSVVVIGGSEFGLRGSTNTMIVENIGNILVRGEKGQGALVKGTIKIFVQKHHDTKEDLANSILVLPKCDPSYIPLMRAAKGVILENHVGDLASMQYGIEMAKRYKLSLIVRAENAMSILQEGEEVFMDPIKAIVYRDEQLKS